MPHRIAAAGVVAITVIGDGDVRTTIALFMCTAALSALRLTSKSLYYDIAVWLSYVAIPIQVVKH